MALRLVRGSTSLVKVAHDELCATAQCWRGSPRTQRHPANSYPILHLPNRYPSSPIEYSKLKGRSVDTVCICLVFCRKHLMAAPIRTGTPDFHFMRPTFAGARFPHSLFEPLTDFGVRAVIIVFGWFTNWVVGVCAFCARSETRTIKSVLRFHACRRSSAKFEPTTSI